MSDICKECCRECGDDACKEEEFQIVLINITIFLQSEENRLNICECILIYLKHYKHIMLSIEGLRKKKLQSEYHYRINKNYIKWLIT